MAQSAQVPKFGEWDNQGNANVPYTQRFDVARKGRSGGKMINPNDPQENPEAFSEAPIPKDDVHASREDDLRKFKQSPLRHHGPAAHKPTATGSPLHGHGYQPHSAEHRKAGRAGAGSEDGSVERSPHHPHYQVKAAARGGVSSSPARGSSEGGHSNPGRSRMKGGGGDETPDRGSSVPKFGEWDENNPSSADGFTGIFEKVREEKRHGPAKSPMISTETIYIDQGGGSSRSSLLGCCFGWCKK